MKLVFLHDATEKYGLAAALLLYHEEAMAMLEEREQEDFEIFVVKNALVESYLRQIIGKLDGITQILFVDVSTYPACEFLAEKGIGKKQYFNIVLDGCKDNGTDKRAIIKSIIAALKTSGIKMQLHGPTDRFVSKYEFFEGLRSEFKHEDMFDFAKQIYENTGDATLFYHLVRHLASEKKEMEAYIEEQNYMTWENYFDQFAGNLEEETVKHLPEPAGKNKNKKTRQEIATDLIKAWRGNQGSDTWRDIVLKQKIFQGIDWGKLPSEVKDWSPDTYECSRIRLIGFSYGMEAIRRKLDIVHGDGFVLVLGASGTGKENIAKQLHFHKYHTFKNFYSYNCANVNEEIMKDDFFGHEKGAFTGAANKREGLFAQADGGTLFLDEIQDMPTQIQGLLLRVLNDKFFIPQGANRAEHTSFRIIAAANKDLGKLVAEGKFRSDLFFRLACVVFQIPPLRERKEDIELIARSYWESRKERAENCCLPSLDDKDIKLLMDYDYPGNVRELQNILNRALATRKKEFNNILKEEKLLTKDFPRDAGSAYESNTSIGEEEKLPEGQGRTLTINEVISAYAWKVYVANKYNATATAKALGISYNTLQHHLGKIKKS